ncbi:hypothetical protein [Chengkuizengella axinellae]|uniref:Lipoprotein n=1 Tax=Chengkuizengella axinellae TaxID=3064388 RepID=A0ABT9IZ07_9BACL|nr:hypothetical protein [Chengkuizengella sp. 2205SS18-9]MDP5274453.1 hypothetical protein [Chengkuizengella sp. 2205SS18-9]
MKKFSLILLTIFCISILSACNFSGEDSEEKLTLEANLELVEFNKNELVNDSDVIIEGKVVSQEVEKDFRGYPVTDTFVKVTKVFKGDPGKEVEIRTKGGETDDMILIVHEDEVPTFEIDEKVILFLSSNKGKRPDKDDFGYYVLGQTQGKFKEKGDKYESKTLKFEIKSFIDELKEIEKSNKENNLKKIFPGEDFESDI